MTSLEKSADHLAAAELALRCAELPGSRTQEWANALTFVMTAKDAVVELLDEERLPDVLVLREHAAMVSRVRAERNGEWVA